MNFEEFFLPSDLHWPLNQHCEHSGFNVMHSYNFANNNYLLISIANKMFIDNKEVLLKTKINNFNANLVQIPNTNIQFMCKSAIVFTPGHYTCIQRVYNSYHWVHISDNHLISNSTSFPSDLKNIFILILEKINENI